MTVYKYELPLDDYALIDMPRGAEPLSVAAQHDMPMLWVRVNPKEPEMVTRRFRIAGTGHPDVPDWPFLGTILMADDRLVLHVFMEPA